MRKNKISRERAGEIVEPVEPVNLLPYILENLQLFG